MKIGIDLYPDGGGEDIDTWVVDCNKPEEIAAAAARLTENLKAWNEPDVPSIEEQIEDETYYAKDGCEVEVDGTCPHGLPSMVMAAGLI